MACFSLQLMSVRQLPRWSRSLLKIQPSLVFFFSCQNIHSSLPAEAHEVSEKTTQLPVFTCSLKFAVPKHPRRWRRNLSGWRARAKTRKCQWVLDREEQRCASCAPVCTRQASPGEEDTATISAKNTVSTSPFHSDWTATSL